MQYIPIRAFQEWGVEPPLPLALRWCVAVEVLTHTKDRIHWVTGVLVTMLHER